MTIILFKSSRISFHFQSKFAFMHILKLLWLCVFESYQCFCMLKALHEQYSLNMKAMSLSDFMTCGHKKETVKKVGFLCGFVVFCVVVGCFFLPFNSLKCFSNV